MSRLILFENKVYSFIEYINYLSESFTIKDVVYGVNDNMDNKKNKDLSTFNIKYNFKGYYTFFKLDDLYFCVTLKKQNDNQFELSFGVKDKFSLNPFHYYNMDKYTAKNTMSLFNNILNIALDIVNKRNIKTIIFSPENPQLGTVYDIMTKNKSFLKILNDNGFKYNMVGKNLYHEIEKI